MKDYVNIKGIKKVFSSGVNPAVDDCSLVIQQGEIHALTGESGSGKSTLLRIIAGLEEPDRGSIVINNHRVLSVESGLFLAPEKRKVGLVFQDNALFPHLTLLQNVAFGIEKKNRRNRALELLDMVKLKELKDRYPHEISGGQAQRIALARALGPSPELLLMDEPFNSLDRRLKGHLIPEIRKTIEQAGITTIFVSHDRNEVFDMSDRISMMRQGQILQTGLPSQLYDQPRDRYTAEFFGDVNIIQRKGRQFILRPEHISLHSENVGNAAIILEKHYRGDHWELFLEVTQGSFLNHKLYVRISGSYSLGEVGDGVNFSYEEERLVEIE